LQGAVSLLALYLKDEKLKTISCTPPTDSEIDFKAATEHFSAIVSYVVWFDIISCITTGINPVLWQRYITLLSAENSDISFERVTGCRNWVIVHLLQVYGLKDWRKQARSAKRFSAWEFVAKATAIKETLTADIAAHAPSEAGASIFCNGRPFSSSPGLDDDIGIVTYIFARATAILLEALMSGANRDLPEIQKHVDAIATTLTFRSISKLPVALSWPICVSGCFAGPVQNQSFEEALSNLDCPGSGRRGNGSDALRIYRRLRDLKCHDDDLDWTKAMESLGKGILSLA
jgi:hypothetical protein